MKSCQIPQVARALEQPHKATWPIFLSCSAYKKRNHTAKNSNFSSHREPWEDPESLMELAVHGDGSAGRGAENSSLCDLK
ncbi:hypothetical protein CK820_G0053830 [Pan troglodytes]|uniref:Uncharacterized protein n=1 Tax=Pan troglodytes TaxID=9598 RepID=A0A2J8PWN3_PANTR|nr:hypothetical protein CK820_G0053830 [Pan troglodytes]